MMGATKIIVQQFSNQTPHPFRAQVIGQTMRCAAGATEHEAVRLLMARYAPELQAPPFYAISLLQPWALLCVLADLATGAAEKSVETRGRLMSFRGPLLIHASAGFPEEYKDLCEQEPFRSVLARHGVTTWRDLPRGKILGGVAITSCVSTNRTSEIDAIAPVGSNERAFGNYAPDRYGIRTIAPWRLHEPIRAAGHQSMPWAVPEEIAAQIVEDPHYPGNAGVSRRAGEEQL